MSLKKNVLVLHGSPRKGRNTDHMLETFLEGAEKNELLDIEHVFVPALNIKPCLACFSCKSSGVCPISDDMQPWYKKISDADSIVIGTPVHFNGVPAWLKIFIDRCQPFYYRKFFLKQTIKPKTGYLLACCDEGKAGPFIGVEKTIEAFFYCINASLSKHYYCVLNGKHFNELVTAVDEVRALGNSVFSQLSQ